jgi:hypothetical protein
MSRIESECNMRKTNPMEMEMTAHRFFEKHTRNTKETYNDCGRKKGGKPKERR